MMTEDIFQSEIAALAQMGMDFDPQPFHFRISNAKQTLRAGLKAVMHHEVEWLKEYDEVADWLTDNHGNGLLLIGPVGVGKTEICMKVIPLIFHRLLQRVMTRLSATDLTTAEHYLDARKKMLLVIDDIGTEDIYNDYGTMHNVFSEVVDRIEKQGILLLATTNLNDEELLSKYGDRTMDRIRANMRIVILDEKSLRGRYSKELKAQGEKS